MSVIPIYLEMDVAEDVLSVDLDVESSSVEFDLDVIPTVLLPLPEYEGPYTVYPTEQEQTLETQGRKMTDDLTIEGVPSDYVGSSVPRKSSDDLTASLAKVTVPAGYYAESASKSIDSARLKSSANVTANPTITVSSSGKISASNSKSQNVYPVQHPGFADALDAVSINVSGSSTSQLSTQASTTITPTEQEQTAVGSQKFTTGEVKVAPIPDRYHDMTGPLAWLGVDAELVDTFTLADVKLSATAFATWTPATQAQDILATRNAGTFVASNMLDYEYYILTETKIPIEYKSGTTNKALPLFLAAVHIQALIRRPSSFVNIQSENRNNNVNANAFTLGNFLRYYGSTAGSITYTWNTSYGFYGTVTAPTISSTTAESPTITVKTPKITARCSTTYMSTGNAALIDQDKTVISQKCYVYRVRKNSFLQGAYDRMIALVNEVSA